MNREQLIFAQNLRRFRKEAGLTQGELGKRLSYSDKAVSKWEGGNAYPPTQILPSLAQVLGIPLELLFSPREEVTYFLGVDGGGTKTKFLLVDANGSTVKEITKGPCNAVNMETAAIRQVLTEGINELCGELPRSSISAYFGLAGISFAPVKKVESIFRSFGFARVDWGADAANTVSAGLRGQDGLIAILGTGSVVFASQKGKLRRFGGYGHLLGDYAGGYELGKCALYAILNQENGSGPQTMLAELFAQQTHRNINEMLMEFYDKGKPFIASFAPLVFEAFRKGDPIARDIVKQNVAAFSQHLKSALALFHGEEEVPLVFSGSVTKGMDVLKPLFERELAGFSVKISILKEDPVMGAVRLAQKGTEQ